MENPFTNQITWYHLKKHFEQQLKATDSKLRRAQEPEASNLRGRAQLLEELLNLPETLQTLAQEDERIRKEKANGA